MNRKATISLKTHEKDQIIPTAEETQKTLNSVFSIMGNACGADSVVREIDGIKAGIVTTKVCGTTEEVYMTEWYPSYKQDFTIISTFPWDEGTLQLLKTIHIEKLNATKKGS